MKLKQFNKRLGDGAWLGVPMQTYQQHPALSSTQIRTLLESPLTYKRNLDRASNESTDAMDYGTAGHGIILQGSIEDFHIHPDAQTNGKPWHKSTIECREWHDAHSDKPAISASQANKLIQDRDYVRNHPKAKKLFADAAFEVSFISGDRKARADVFQVKRAVVSDLKIVADASDREMSKMILKYGYHIQFAWYRNVMFLLGVEVIAFYMIALQKGPQPLVNVIEVSPRSIKLGESKCEEALELLDQCRLNNFWPEWADYDGTDTIKPIDIPEYAYGNEPLELEVGGEVVGV